MNKNKLYWIFQISAWTIHYLFYGILTATQPDAEWIDYVSIGIFIIAGFLITHLFRNYVKKNNWIAFPIKKLVFRILITSFLLSIVWNIIYFIDLYAFYGAEKKFFNPIYITALLVNLSIIMLVWQMIYFIFHIIQNYQKIEVEKWRAEAQAKEAQLNSLKRQLNPHFVFNALNSVRALIVEDPKQAQEMITQLSNLIRYTLQSEPKELVRLDDELAIVKDYLSLESIRFEDRLKINLQIDPKSNSFMVPPMILQTLVENAIKHGISKFTQGGELSIISIVENNQLVLQIRNPGKFDLGNKTDESTGVGLKNSSERLNLLFGGGSRLVLSNESQNQVLAELVIPEKGKQ